MDLRLHNLIVVDQLQKTMQFYNLKFRSSWQCSFQTKSIMTPGAADPAAYLIREFVATSSGANAIFWKDWLMNSWDSGQGYSKHAASGHYCVYCIVWALNCLEVQFWSTKNVDLGLLWHSTSFNHPFLSNMHQSNQVISYQMSHCQKANWCFVARVIRPPSIGVVVTYCNP